eukprot:scaffold76198_cov51-Phaeocystis_antarctica.AAC.1
MTRASRVAGSQSTATCHSSSSTPRPSIASTCRGRRARCVRACWLPATWSRYHTSATGRSCAPARHSKLPREPTLPLRPRLRESPSQSHAVFGDRWSGRLAVAGADDPPRCAAPEEGQAAAAAATDGWDVFLAKALNENRKFHTGACVARPPDLSLLRFHPTSSAQATTRQRSGPTLRRARHRRAGLLR